MSPVTVHLHGSCLQPQWHSHGHPRLYEDFTSDLALAVKALRIPVGNPGAFSSPYLALQDSLKRRPDKGGEGRSIIMINSGIDYFRGDGSGSRGDRWRPGRRTGVPDEEKTKDSTR